MQLDSSLTGYSIELRFTPGINRVFLRDLYGHAELAVHGAGSDSALALLGYLLTDQPSQEGHVPKATELVVADRDTLMAGIYVRTYGYRLDSTVDCINCQLPFDLAFNLEDLIAHTRNSDGGQRFASLNGIFTSANGKRFRLPTGEDELAIAGQPLEKASLQLLERCLIEGEFLVRDESIELAMEEIAPILQTDLLANCPECETEQTVHFDMQSFLLNRLKQEKNRLMQEIHQLAKTYHWGYNEILDLPRSSRKKYASLINAEA